MFQSAEIIFKYKKKMNKTLHIRSKITRENMKSNENITKADLVELLNIAMKNQLFQFEGTLYEQVDGVVNWACLWDP